LTPGGGIAGQEAREALLADLRVVQFGDAVGAFLALRQPAAYILPEEEQHANFGVPAGQQTAFQLVPVGAVVRDQAGHHQSGFGILQQGGGRDAFVERVQDQGR
jgi:hypothetical protein